MSSQKLIKIAAAKLPTAFGDYDIAIYQDLKTGVEHVVLLKGQVSRQHNILTRVHSECLTGDIFSSSRCDCGEQLTLAQQRINAEGAGIIIYLRDHEGRGIGLANKIRAYALQDQGFDTVDANIALGLPVDNRCFDIAAELLTTLNIRSIRLLSNNPDKLNALKKRGIIVNSLVPLAIVANKNNVQYLQTKQFKLGHLLETV